MTKYYDIDKINSIEVDIDYKEIIDKYSNKAKSKLAMNSPSDTKGRKNGDRKYKDSWELKVTDKKDTYEVIVWNKDNWWLTHLLENGHLIVNTKNGTIGWAKSNPHIRPAYYRVKSAFIYEMENVPIKAKFK